MNWKQWKPSDSNNEPLFRQIARFYEDLILNGTLPPGTRLPSERKLALDYGVNRSTVVAAYDELRSTGLVHSIRGSGTHVSEDIWGVHPSRIPNWSRYTEKGSFLPTAPVLQKVREAGSDEAIINLAKGELSPELFPNAVISNLMHSLSGSMQLGYPDSQGDCALRETLCNHLLNRYHMPVSPDQILITSGSQQALHLITQCLLSPGDAVAMEETSYAYSLPLFPSAGLQLIRIPMDVLGIDPESILSLHQKHPIRMLFLNPTHQNPTGTTLPLVRRKRLLEICESLRIPIVEDDAFGALTFSQADPPPLSLYALNEGKGTVLYLGTLSKTAAPGLRVGWLVGPPAVIQRLANAKEQIDYGSSVIPQHLANAYIASGAWNLQVEHLNQILNLRKNQMMRILHQNLGDHVRVWANPGGGYHLWGRILDPIVRDIQLLEAGIQNGVLFMPGTVYGADKGYVRLTFARADETSIEAGLQRFKKTFLSLNQQTLR